MGKKKNVSRISTNFSMSLVWFIVLLAPSRVVSQICQGDIAFEKMTNIAAPDVHMLILSGSDEQPVSKDCLLLCRQTPDCLGFNLNYTTHECNVLTFNERNKIQKSSLITSSGTTLFRKMCLPSGTHSKCTDHPWVIERVFNSFMDDGPVDDKEQAISTDECSALCISAKMCRSATYDPKEQKCTLHREDRRTKPTSFHTKPDDEREYLENQCLVTKSANCHYKFTNNSAVITKDALTSANSQTDCEHACDKSVRTLCRAFSYEHESKICYLSADDVISLNSSVSTRDGSIYGERKCIPENCTGGPSAFERVTGRVLRTANAEGNPQAEDLSVNLTATCLEQCREKGFSCVGVIIDYMNFLCQFLNERNTGATFTDFAIAEGASYFERVCLTAIPTSCLSRTWMFDRVPGAMLEGLDEKILKGTLSRSECEDACLKEKSFICRSAEFNSAITECRLSREDRRTRPDAFKAKSLNVDYLENQCVPQSVQCTTEKMDDAFPTYIDAIKHNVTSAEQCVDECLHVRKFSCRAVGYRFSSRDCYLSSVDKVAGGKDSIQPRPETVYLSTKCKVGSENIQLWTTLAPFVSTEFWPPKPPVTGLPFWVPTTGRCDKKNFGTQIYVKTPGFALAVEEMSFSTFTAAVPGFTGECRRRCDLDLTCTGFTVDYVQLRCHLHGINVEEDSSRQKLVRSPSSAYFEILCIKAVSGCNRLWIFDRFLDKNFVGITSETFTGISKTGCLETCLAEKRFTCRSVTYDRFRGECRLSTEDRFSQPEAFVDARGSDYFENQCAGFPVTISPRDVGGCEVIRRHGKMLLFAEKSTTVLDEDECEEECSSNPDFICRSFSFVDNKGECLLSPTTADDLKMELTDKSDAIYVERTCHKSLPFRTIITDVSPTSCTAAGFSMERTVGFAPKMKKINAKLYNSSTVIGMSKNCVQQCHQRGEECMGFVRRLGNPCVTSRRQIDRKMLIPSPGTVYFEKICLRAIGCGKLWTFDRLIGYELSYSEIRRVHVGVSTRAECQELCLQEGAFICRSAVYFYSVKECRLFSQTRHSQPRAFRRSKSTDVDYFENQCTD